MSPTVLRDIVDMVSISDCYQLTQAREGDGSSVGLFILCCVIMLFVKLLKLIMCVPMSQHAVHM